MYFIYQKLATPHSSPFVILFSPSSVSLSSFLLFVLLFSPLTSHISTNLASLAANNASKTKVILISLYFEFLFFFLNLVIFDMVFGFGLFDFSFLFWFRFFILFSFWFLLISFFILVSLISVFF